MWFNKRVALLLMIVLLAMCVGCDFAFASCPFINATPTEIAQTGLKSYDAVFSGRVVNITDSDGLDAVDFEINRSWKGVTGKTARIIDGSLFGKKFSLGESYLVYATYSEYTNESKDSGNLRVSACGSTGSLEYAQEEVAYLEENASRIMNPETQETTTLRQTGENEPDIRPYLVIGVILLAAVILLTIRNTKSK